MRKIFTLLASLLLASGISYADTIELNPSNIDGSSANGLTKFKSGYQITNKDGKTIGGGNNAMIDGTTKNYFKFANIQYTIVIPADKQVTSITISGGSRKTGKVSTISELNGQTTAYEFVDGLDKQNVQPSTHKIDFSAPVTGSITFTTTSGTSETLYRFTLIDGPVAKNPSWSAESFTAIIGGENSFPVINDAANNTFTYASSDEAVATIVTDGTISLVGAGTTIISATYKNAENADVTISYTLEVLAAGATKDAKISFSATSYSGNFAGETSALPTFVNPNNISGVTFTSSNPSFAAVDNNGKVTINTVNVNNKNYWAADGEATITAAFAGDDVYSEATVSYTIKINPMTVVDDFTEIALDNVTMATLPTAIDVTVGDVLAITANHALTQKEDAPTISGKSFANYIQIRANNAPSASNPKGTLKEGSATLTLAPTDDMTVYLYGRRQSNTKNTANGIIRQFNVNDGKSIKVCDAGETSDFAAIPQKIAFSHWANDVLKEYAYNVVAVELEAGKTYTVWAAGTTYQLYGVGYELAPLAAPVHGHGVDGTETEIELPSNTEIKLSHADNDANIMWRWVGETANDPAGDAPEVVALAEETAPADGGWTNYNDEKPVFNHDKDMTLEFYAEKNGVKSETKNLLVKLAETVGIADINVDNANAPVEYFNLQGIRVDNPSNGIFIRRQGNEVSKVIIK